MSSAAEGWYLDPSTGTNQRFWNGTTWTDEVRPLPDAPDRLPMNRSSQSRGTSAKHAAAETDVVPLHWVAAGESGSLTGDGPRHAL